jgi:hypothetical protein
MIVKLTGRLPSGLAIKIRWAKFSNVTLNNLSLWIGIKGSVGI